MLNNRRGILSDAMTWIVATIVIVILLIIFIYSANILGKANALRQNAKEILINDNSEGNIDLFEEKTLMGYKINLENKEKIDLWRDDED